MRANEPGAHLPHGARAMVKGVGGNPSGHRQGLGDSECRGKSEE